MLRDVSDIDATSFSFAESRQRSASSIVDIHGGPSGATATIPDAHLLFNADFVRAGNDLILRGHDGGSAFVRDYFASDARATLMSRDGAKLSGELIDAMAGTLAPGQYAQAGQPAAPPAASDAVGRVVTASGDATIIRNGVAVTLKQGDPVLRADVLQTHAGTLAVTFNDGSTLNLTANTRIVVSDFVYSPNGAGNSQLLNLVQGSLTFISGEVAHSGNMRIGTPVATMGIRGTVGGVTTANDGTVHFYVSQSATGAVIINEQGQIIANVVQDGPMIVVHPAGPLQVIAEEVQKTPAQLAQELAALQQIVSIKAVGDQILQQFLQPQNPNNPNPQSPQDQPHTQIQIDLHHATNDPNDGNPPGGNTGPIDQATVHLISTNPTNPDAPTIVTDLLLTNLPPVTFAPLTATVNEDQTLTFSGAATVSVYDADTTVLTVSLTVTHGLLTLSGTSGLTFSAGNGANAATMTFSGTQAAINAALDGMTYTPSQDYNGDAALTITTQDDAAHVITTSVSITVAAVNDAPVLTPSGPSTTLAATDTASAGMTVASLLAGHVTDVDAGAVAGIAIIAAAANYGNWQYSLDNGAHWLDFSSYSSSSALLLAADDLVRFVPDGHNAGTDTFTYVAWDQTTGTAGDTVSIATQGGSSAFSTASDVMTVTVANNHAPSFDAATYHFSINENSAFGTLIGSVHATDADNDTLAYTISSGDADHVFSVDSHGGILVSGLLDYESFTGRDIVVTATDIWGAKADTSVHIDIQNTAEPSSITLSSSAGTSVTVSQYGATNGFQFAGAGNVTTPGIPEDRIVLGFDLGGHNYVVNEAPMVNDNGMTPVATSSYAVGGVNYFSTILSAGHGVTLTETIGLGADANYFTTNIDIFNGSGADLSNVRFMRNLDPDQDHDIQNGTYDTYNDVLQNPSGSHSVAAVQAVGPITGTAVALVGDGGYWRASAFGFTNTDPYASYAYDNPQDPNGARADIAIALTNNIGDIANGGVAHISFITTANVATTGANALIGTSAGDTIDGLGGGDLLFGLGGADTFVFKAGYGSTTIYDFSGHNGDGDAIAVDGFNISSFADLQKNATISDIGTATDHTAKIDFGGGDAVTLLHVDPTQLTAADFIFHPASNMIG